MTEKGYNAVKRPNPEGSRPKTGVMSQGHDGNIRPDTDMDEAGENVRWAEGITYGEDAC